MFYSRYSYIVFLAFLMVIWPAGRAYAQIETAVQLFDEGNELYRAGSYREAIDIYHQAVESGYTSVALYYNLGNAYFRVDEVGQSIRYYEKARLLDPENRELLHNLEIASARAVDQFSQLPQPAWVTWWKTMTARSGGRWMFWLGAFFYFAAIGLVIYKVKFSSRNPWLRRARAVTVLLGCIFLGGGFAASVQSVEAAQAVILVEETALKVLPDAESDTEVDIHEGLVVDILQESNVWLEIRLPNGTRGWVPAEVTGDI